MTINDDGGFTSQDDRTFDTITSDVLPEGSETFSITAVVSDDGNFTSDDTRALGVGGEGFVARGGNVPQGAIVVEAEGDTLESIDVVEELYSIHAPPPDGVISAGSVSFDGITLSFIGEDGSVASTSITTFQTYNIDLGELTVNVNDVDGNGVAGSQITIAGNKFSTDGDGQVIVGSSGSVNITALRGTDSKSTTVSDGGQASVTFTFAGVEGSIKTPDGGGVTGTTVILKDSNGSEIDRTETDSNGEYSFKELPVNSTATIESGPFTREFATPDEGVQITKKVPFNTDVSGVSIQATNATTGEYIVDVDITVGDFSGRSNSRGIGRAISTDDGTKEVIVSEEDRRYIQENIEVSLQLNDTVSEVVELEEKKNIGNSV